MFTGFSLGRAAKRVVFFDEMFSENIDLVVIEVCLRTIKKVYRCYRVYIEY
jgi:hypothetical protein